MPGARGFGYDKPVSPLMYCLAVMHGTNNIQLQMFVFIL